MLPNELIGVSDEDDLFDLRQFVPHRNHELGRITSSLLVLCERQQKPQRAVDVRTLAEETEIAATTKRLVVTECHLLDPFVHVAEDDLVLRETFLAAVHRR